MLKQLVAYFITENKFTININICKKITKYCEINI